MRAHFAAALALALALATVATPARAAAQEAGGDAVAPQDSAEIVRRIVVEGNERYTDAQLVSALGQPVGQPFDEEEVRRGIQTLFQTFHVRSEVLRRPLPASEGGGVDLLLRVRELPLDLEPRFVGNVRVKDAKLREWAGIGDGSELFLYQAPRIRERLLTRYRAEGYYFVEIEVVERAGGADAETGVYRAPDVIFEIEEGPKVKVRAVVVDGNEHIPDRGFLFFRRGLKKLADLDLHGPRIFSFFASAFVREKLDADVIALRTVYRDQGYLDAVVGIDRLEFTQDRRWVTIHVIVDEGELYTIGSTSIETIETFADPARQGQLLERPVEPAVSPAELMPRLELQPGAILKRTSLEEDERLIRNEYGKLGYIDHSSLPAPDRLEVLEPILEFEEDEPVVHLTYRVRQGRRQYIREVLVSGNLHTQDRVIRRLITVEPGQLADLEQIARSRNRIQGTGYFSDDRDPVNHREPEFRFLPTGDPNWKDLEFIQQEGQDLTFQLQGGISSNAGAFGIFSVEKRNADVTDMPESPLSLIQDIANRNAFHGAGQDVRLQISPGTQVSFFSLLFREPDLFRTHKNRVSLTLTARRRFRNYESHDEERDEYGFELGKQVGEDGAVFVGWTFGKIDVDDIDTGPEPSFGDEPPVANSLLTEEGKHDLSYFDVGYRYRTTDSPLIPRNGTEFRVAMSVYQEGLLSDFSFTKTDLTWDFYDEFDEESKEASDRYHLGLHAGVAVPYGDTDEVPYTERFFLGGLSELRGFDYRGVGPQEGRYPAGGETLLFATLEYRRPLVTDVQPGTYREVELMQGGVFFDVGVLDPDAFELDLNEVRMSAGFLFGISVPIPIVFSFGFPLRQRDGDDTQILGFNIGF